MLQEEVKLGFHLRVAVDALNAYRGEYMTQYSWAELTVAKLQFAAAKGK